MFGLFSKDDRNMCPIDPEMRLWMENSFLWLATQFGHDNIGTKQMLYPTFEHFPFTYDGSLEVLSKTSELVARQMEIDPDEINLEVFDEDIKELSKGGHHSFWTEVDPDSEVSLAAGVFFDKSDNGKYDIFIEQQNMTDPEDMVATIAHEFSHIKLLGERRLDVNDESLTDLTTVVFGLGIFNANAAYKEWKSNEGFGYNSMGYLKQKEWGYALALYAYFRGEQESGWTKYLTPNLQSDFKRSMEFINANQDKVFIEEYHGRG